MKRARDSIAFVPLCALTLAMAANSAQAIDIDLSPVKIGPVLTSPFLQPTPAAQLVCYESALKILSSSDALLLCGGASSNAPVLCYQTALGFKSAFVDSALYATPANPNEEAIYLCAGATSSLVPIACLREARSILGPIDEYFETWMALELCAGATNAQIQCYQAGMKDYYPAQFGNGDVLSLCSSQSSLMGAPTEEVVQ